jgi:hypothetical protein
VPDTRAAALFEQNDAVGLRALAHHRAHFAQTRRSPHAAMTRPAIRPLYQSLFSSSYSSLIFTRRKTTMALLKLESKAKPRTLTVHLDANIVEELNLYCRYAKGSIDSAIRESLLYVFGNDQDFQKWKQSSDNLQEEKPGPGRPKAAPVPAGPASQDPAASASKK